MYTADKVGFCVPISLLVSKIKAAFKDESSNNIIVFISEYMDGDKVTLTLNIENDI